MANVYHVPEFKRIQTPVILAPLPPFCTELANDSRYIEATKLGASLRRAWRNSKRSGLSYRRMRYWGNTVRRIRRRMQKLGHDIIAHSSWPDKF